jgi:hypothetical protein
MALSPEDRQEIIDIIQATHSTCGCGLSPESQAEVGHFFGRVKDLGKGNLNEGIEIFSRAIALVAAFRRCGEKVGGTLATFVLISILGGVSWIIGLGIKRWIEQLIQGGGG